MARKKIIPQEIENDTKEIEETIERSKVNISQSYIMLGAMMISFVVIMVLISIQYFNNKDLQITMNKVSSETSNIETIQYNILDRIDSIQNQTNLYSENNQKFDLILNNLQKSVDDNNSLIKKVENEIDLLSENVKHQK